MSNTLSWQADTIANQAVFIDRHTILFQRKFAVSLERLWTAITEKSELDQWFIVTELDLKNGGKYSFEGGWDGWISDLKSGHHLQFNTSETSFTRFAIEAIKDGSLFSLTDKLSPETVFNKPEVDDDPEPDIVYHQPGGPGTHWTGVIAGWHCFVDALEGHLRGELYGEEYEQLCEFYDHILVDYLIAVDALDLTKKEKGGKVRVKP